MAPIRALPDAPNRRLPAGRAALVAVAALALTAALVGVATTASAATLLSDDFEDGNSTGWTTSGGSWSVSGGTFNQTGTSADARARAGQLSWADYTVSVRVRPNAFNGTNRFVAVLARAQSNTSYYYVALRSSNTVELKKLVGGSATTLASAPVTVSIGTWYTVSLTVSGTSLRSTVNGGTALTATDTQFAAGQAGVATFNASGSFDNVLVETVSGPSPTTPGPSPSTPGPGQSTPSPGPVPPGQPIGFAAVPALGLNGTTGGAGGPVVTVTTTDQLLTAIDTIGPMIIRVQGTPSTSPASKGYARTRPSSAWAPRPSSTVAGWTSTGRST